MPNRPHRLLALDGGGSWALIQARALERLYNNAPGREILAEFDLVAATSGGSIVLAALIENRTPAQAAEMFLQKPLRESVFVKRGAWGLGFLGFWVKVFGRVPRYSTKPKLDGFRRAFPTLGDEVLSGLPPLLPRGGGGTTHVLVTAFDIDKRRATFFRSNLASRAAGWNPKPPPTLAEALHASSNAPIVYFDEPARLPSQGAARYWDGGLTGHNNPVLAGATELVMNAFPPGEIAALSIGTANTPPPGGTKKAAAVSDRPLPDDLSLKDAMGVLATTVLDDPPDMASFIAHAMLGGRASNGVGDAVDDGPVVRLNPLVQPSALPPGVPEPLSTGEIDRLAAMDMDAVADDEVALIDRLAGQWLAGGMPNQAVRANSDGSPQVGHATFSQGRQAWAALTS